MASSSSNQSYGRTSENQEGGNPKKCETKHVKVRVAAGRGGERSNQMKQKKNMIRPGGRKSHLNESLDRRRKTYTFGE